MRRALVLLALLALILVGCGDDGGGDGADEDASDETVTTEPSADDPPPTTTGADDEVPDTVCADLAGIAEIDPAVQPTQDDVDAVRAVAEDLPEEAAAAMNLIADIGQFIADLTPDQLSNPDALAGLADIATEEEQAAAGATLVAYADEECGLSVPLFDDFV